MENSYLVFKEFLKRRQEKHQIIEQKAEVIVEEKPVKNVVEMPTKQNKYANEDLSGISPIALDLLGLRR